MPIRKKSLIGDRTVVKKAMIASQSAEGNEHVGDGKGLQAGIFKAKTLKASALRAAAFRAASMKKR